MNHCWTWALLGVMVFASCGCQEAADPIAQPPAEALAQPPAEALVQPLELSFGSSCGLPKGKQQAYDAKTGVFHVHFTESKQIGMLGSGLFERSGFQVTKAPGPFVKPLKFRLTGVPLDYGCVGDPLSLCVGDGACYALVEAPTAKGPVDATLFRVESQRDVVMVEFTEKGRALLKPGTLISFQMDTGW
jgi:hypothetical protein